MTNASVKYKEIRFLIEENHTDMYVRCEAQGDCPLGVQGWHFKCFPGQDSIEILLWKAFGPQNEESPIMWPQKSPDPIPRRG